MKNLKLLIILLLFNFSAISYGQLEYYTSNRALNSINQYDSNGAFVSEIIAQNSGGLSSPQDIVFHPDGFMLVSSNLSNQILKYDQTTGAYIGVWNLATLTRPTKMSIGPDNLLYVTQWGQTPVTSRILKFNLDGTFHSPLNTTIPTPLGMGHVWDNQGNFYIALFGTTTNSGSVHKFDPNGNSLGTFIDSSILENPTYIWWDTNGDMLVEDFSASKVLRYDSDGNYLSDFIVGIANPEGYAYLPNGNLLVVERTFNQISEFDSTGTFIGQWDSGAVLDDPNLLVIRDPLIAVTDYTTTNILVIPSIGETFEFNSSGISELEFLSVYNSAGILIENIDLNNTTQWEAGRYPEGMYFLSGSDGNRSKFVQKIIVKR